MEDAEPSATESPPVASGPTLPEGGLCLRDELFRYQDALIEQALRRAQGNRAQAARLLGLKRTTLVMMLRAQALRVGRSAVSSSPGP